MASKRPYFYLKYHSGPADNDIIQSFKDQYPKLKNLLMPTEQETLDAIYKSEYSSKYGHNYLAAYSKSRPPASYTIRADPIVALKPHDPPFSSIKALTCEVYDPHRGAHEWRDLTPKPGMYVWQPLEKIPALSNPGRSSTMLPVRLKHHDQKIEKERWDNIRNLVRNDALGYAYRTNVSGYTGWRQNVVDITSCLERKVHPNLGMVSSTHAQHRNIPLDPNQLPQVGKDSRVVTFTNANEQLKPSCD